jgi:hypothetical protein
LETLFQNWSCPACGSHLSVTPYPNKTGKYPGFRLDCFGTDEKPHRLRIYLDKFGIGAAAFAPEKTVAAVEAPRNSRVKDLLARAEKLAA